MTIPSGPVDPTRVSQSLTDGKATEVEQLVRRGELLKASEEFESYFLAYLMKVMRETVPQGTLTANRMGELFYSFYEEELGKRAAQGGGIGLSQYVLASLADLEREARDSTGPRSFEPF